MVGVGVLVGWGFIAEHSWCGDAGHFNRIYPGFTARDTPHDFKHIRLVEKAVKRLQFLYPGVDLVPDRVGFVKRVTRQGRGAGTGVEADMG